MPPVPPPNVDDAGFHVVAKNHSSCAGCNNKPFHHAGHKRKCIDCNEATRLSKHRRKAVPLETRKRFLEELNEGKASAEDMVRELNKFKGLFMTRRNLRSWLAGATAEEQKRLKDKYIGANAPEQLSFLKVLREGEALFVGGMAEQTNLSFVVRLCGVAESDVKLVVFSPAPGTSEGGRKHYNLSSEMASPSLLGGWSLAEHHLHKGEEFQAEERNTLPELNSEEKGCWRTEGAAWFHSEQVRFRSAHLQRLEMDTTHGLVAAKGTGQRAGSYLDIICKDGNGESLLALEAWLSAEKVGPYECGLSCGMVVGCVVVWLCGCVVVWLWGCGVGGCGVS